MSEPRRPEDVPEPGTATSSEIDLDLWGGPKGDSGGDPIPTVIDWTAPTPPQRPVDQPETGDGRVARRPPTQSRAPRREVTAKDILRSTSRGLLYTLVFILLLTAADAVFVAWQVQSGLTAAARTLTSGFEKLQEGDPKAAKLDLENALKETQSVQEALRHPSVRLAGMIPLTSRDVGAIDALTATAATAGRAGSTVGEILTELGTSRERISAGFYSEGTVNVEAIQEVAPRLSETARDLFLAYDRLASIEQAPRLRVVANALESAEGYLLAASETTDRADRLFSLLPSSLGADEERRYLLLFQALGESRGTGGVAGLYGVLTASDGQLDLESIQPYSTLGQVKSTDTPPWFKESYAFQSATEQWPQANVSPNFPAVAQVMLSMYENSSGEVLDGVLAMDPIALSTLMQGTGPLQVGPRNITADEMDELLLVESYVDFPDAERQNDFLERVVTTFWDELSAAPEDPEGIITGFGEAIDRQHLKFYLADEEEQLALTELKADGSYATAGDGVQMLFTNNYSTNKVDYFLKRSTRTNVLILPDGTAQVDVTVTLKNDAPVGAPDLLLGEGTDTLPPGGNSSLVSLLMPVGAQAGSTSVNNEKVPVLTYQDENHPVSWALVDIPPQDEAQLSFSYELPQAVDLSGGGAFSLTLFPQAAVNAETYRLRLGASDSMTGDEVVGREIRTQGTLNTPAMIEIAFDTLGR